MRTSPPVALALPSAAAASPPTAGCSARSAVLDCELAGAGGAGQEQTEEAVEGLHVQRLQWKLAAHEHLSGLVLGKADERRLPVPVEKLMWVDHPGGQNGGLGAHQAAADRHADVEHVTGGVEDEPPPARGSLSHLAPKRRHVAADAVGN